MSPGFNFAVATAYRPMEQSWDKDSRWFCNHITKPTETFPFMKFYSCHPSGVKPRGVGGTPLYKPYRYVPPQPHIPIHFVHFGLESGWAFEGTTEVFLLFQFQMSKKEREICEFEMDLNNFCVCVPNLIMIT